MNYEELLHEYFDSGLDEQREEALFAGLSNDSGLRREFGELMQLRTLARDEAAGVMPPVELTASVFSALGYSPTPAAQSAPPIVVVPSSSSGRLASIAPYIATSIISSLLTTLALVFFLWPSGKDTVERTNAAPSAGQTVAVRQSGSGSDITGYSSAQNSSTPAADGLRPALTARESVRPNTSAYSNTSDRTNASVRTKTPARDMGAILDNSNPLAASSPVVPEAPEYIFATSAPVVMPHHSIEIAEQADGEQFHYSNASASTWFAPDLEWELLDISLRSSAMASSPWVNVPTQEQNIKVPIAISVLYKLSEESSIGVEFGREAFAQKFAYSLRSESVTILQNPTLLWGGVAYRYMLKGVPWDNFAPFTQLTIGAAEVGPLARLKLGLNWSPLSNLILSAGAEGGVLSYSVGGQSHATTKLGAFYGIGIRF